EASQVLLVAPEIVGEMGVDGNSLLRELDRGGDQVRERPRPELLPREAEPRDASRDPRRERAEHARLRPNLPLLVEVHVALRRERRLLPEVEGRRLPARPAPEEESPSAEVPRLRVDDGEGEGGRDRGVGRVPSLPEDVEADAGGERLLRDDHEPLPPGGAGV